MINKNLLKMLDFMEYSEQLKENGYTTKNYSEEFFNAKADVYPGEGCDEIKIELRGRFTISGPEYNKFKEEFKALIEKYRI